MGVVGSLSVDVQERRGVLSDSDPFGQTEKRMRGGKGGAKIGYFSWMS